MPARLPIMLTGIIKLGILAAVMEAALQQFYLREGAISLHLIDARQELGTCLCLAEQALIERLKLTGEQVSGIRGRDAAHKADVLTSEQRTLLDALRPRPVLADHAIEAGRMGWIPDPIPRFECLCP